MTFLTMAYSVIWIIIAIYILILISRNRKLLSQIDDLENRIRDLEQGTFKESDGPS